MQALIKNKTVQVFDGPSQKRNVLSWSFVINVLIFLGPDQNSPDVMLG